MPIRDWTGGGIVRLWVVGLALELTLIVVPVVWSGAVERRLAGQGVPPSSTAVRTPTPAARAFIRQALRDSLGLELSARGGTVDVRARSPRGDSLMAAARRSVIQLDTLAGKVQRTLLLICAAIYLPIPLLLAGITLYWRHARSRGGQHPTAAVV